MEFGNKLLQAETEPLHRVLTTIGLPIPDFTLYFPARWHLQTNLSLWKEATEETAIIIIACWTLLQQ